MKTKKRIVIPMPARYAINTALVVLLFACISLLVHNVFSTYQSKVLLVVGINIILAVSLNVATGYLGQLPLGHAGFMAVGAYTCALFTKYTPLPKGPAFALGLLLGALMAGLFGVLIGIPALRLTGDYLAILTLGFGEIIRITLNNIDGVLGFNLFYGSKGLKNIPKYSNYIWVFVCVVLTCFVIHAMMKSRHGRAVLAVRDNEIAAESCGIQTTYYKVMAFAVSAAFAGLAGGLYACYIGVLNPANFGFMKSIEVLVMVVLGGMGSMLGSILAATVLTILPEALRSFSDYRMVVYSLVLIIMMIFRPGGLLGSYDFSMSRLLEKCLNGDWKNRKKKAAQEKEAGSNG
jgi:branched-chain amino acid transport system permease protein